MFSVYVCIFSCTCFVSLPRDLFCLVIKFEPNYISLYAFSKIVVLEKSISILGHIHLNVNISDNKDHYISKVSMRLLKKFIHLHTYLNTI